MNTVAVVYPGDPTLPIERQCPQQKALTEPSNPDSKVVVRKDLPCYSKTTF